MNDTLLLFVIAFVAVVALVMISRRQPGYAVLLSAAIGGAAGFFACARRADAAGSGFTSTTTAPPGAAPPAVVPGTFAAPRLGGGAVVAAGADEAPAAGPDLEYPGAVDFDDMETAPALGHTDRREDANEDAPRGNPFETGRIGAPAAAPPCVDDDAVADLDGDEQNALQARSRNDPTRVWAGIHRRYALVDRYVREELDETEDTRWWGRHEV